MNKSDLLQKYEKPEDKLLASKIIDKIEMCKKRNIVTNTDFLSMYEIKIAENILNSMKCNYVFFGGVEEASRVIAIIYPEKLNERIIEDYYKDIIEIIRIELPNSLKGKYMHKDYLSGVMKLGIKREKCGDILVEDNGADIIVLKEIADYLETNLKNLTRFSKSKINKVDLSEIKQVEIKKQEIKIIVQSIRLDSIIAQLVNTSRTKAVDIISQGRVYINYENEIKNDKILNVGDILVIRGKGKFEFTSVEGNTKKNRFVLIFKKYV